MPKLKSHSGAKKRFKKTASGKFKHERANQRHLMTPMLAKRKRFLRKSDMLNDTDSATIRRFLPNA
ncbi:MAG: 50S ribosomal protein L35 [Elusimicrobia bacterium]|nr:50S ribosomal protein L35 [Elusimicrobiota bacterium]